MLEPCRCRSMKFREWFKYHTCIKDKHCTFCMIVTNHIVLFYVHRSMESTLVRVDIVKETNCKPHQSQ